MSDLPPGWECAAVGEILSEVRSGFASGRHNKTGAGIQQLRPMNVSRQGEIDMAQVKYVDPSIDDRRVTPGDILFNNTNSPVLVGKTALVRAVDGEVAFSNHMTRLRVLPGIDPAFVANQLHFLWMTGQLRGLITNHVNQASISASVLAQRVTLAVPPAAEQERIVTAIDEHLSRLHAAEAAVQSAQVRVGTLNRAVLSQAQDEGDETALDNLLADIEAGKSFKTSGRRAHPDEWGVIKVSAMTWGQFDEAENKAVPGGTTVDPRYEIRPGDLLLSRANTSEYVGATVLVDSCRRRLLLSDKSMRLMTRDGVNRRWLRFALGSPQIRSQMSKLATGTSDSMRNISQAKVRALRIRTPDTDRQEVLADEIDEALRARERLEAELRATRSRASGLRRSILAAAFSGKLVPHDPDDEPGSVLLDRIRAEHGEATPAKRTRKRARSR